MLALSRCYLVISLYRGIIPYKQISCIYILRSEEIYRRHSYAAIDSIHIYSIYHRLILAHLPTELYPLPLVEFLLTKFDISNYLRLIAVGPSEHIMTSEQR